MSAMCALFMPYSCARFYGGMRGNAIFLLSGNANSLYVAFWVRSNGNGYSEISKETVMSCHFPLPRGNAAASACVSFEHNACCQMAGGAA